MHPSSLVCTACAARLGQVEMKKSQNRPREAFSIPVPCTLCSVSGNSCNTLFQLSGGKSCCHRLFPAFSFGKSLQKAMVKLALKITPSLPCLKGSRLDLSCQKKKPKNSKNGFAQLFPVAPLAEWPALGWAENACCGGSCDGSACIPLDVTSCRLHPTWGTCGDVTPLLSEESSSVFMDAATFGSGGKTANERA